MSMASKRWEDHTPAWRAKHAAKGETKALWNKFLGLAPTTQKKFSAPEYAAGKKIPVQLVEQRKTAYRETMASMGARPSTVELGLSLMNNEQLKWAATAEPSQIQIRGRSHDPKHFSGKRNVWWYK